MAEDKARDEDSGRARGGQARAEKLPEDRRREIARAGAVARWEEVPQAVCGSPDRPVRIGNAALQAYVLGDGTRVLTQAELLVALGRHRKAAVRRNKYGDELPPVLFGDALRPFISEDLIQQSQPVRFRTPEGSRASGYRAEVLPEICKVYLNARDAGKLTKSQLHIAAQADILIRGLATVGIIALVDEATGYQAVRTQDALARILEAFIEKELRGWVRTFPTDFYQEMFRLRGLKFPHDSVKRPQYFGVLTNDIVYARLAPGVLAELRRITPKDETGRRKHKFFQRLTSNIGYPKLREHLGSVVAIMKLSGDWDDFMTKLSMIHPRDGQNYELYLPEYASDDGKGL
ncbi:MAG: P63C domain-containing protein [Gemmatimonadales bacterium]